MTDDGLVRAVAGGALPSESACTALLTALARTARATFGAGACSILRHDGATDELVFEAVGRPGDEALVGRRFPASIGIAGWALTSEQTVIIDDVQGDDRFAAQVAEETDYVPEVIMAAPLLTEDRAIGVIEVLDRDEGAASGLAAMELLGLVADQAALALGLVEQIRGSRSATDGSGAELTAVAALARITARLEGERREAGVALLHALAGVLDPAGPSPGSAGGR